MMAHGTRHDDQQIGIARTVALAPFMPSSTLNLVDSLEDHNDVAAWINDVLGSHDVRDSDVQNPANLTELDQHVTQLLASLEIAYQDTSSQL